MDLSKQRCVACAGDMTPLPLAEVEGLLSTLAGWKNAKGTIRKDYTFHDFKEAIEFVNKVAAIAETEGHHPDIFIWYKVVTLVLTTHAIGGLSMNDFILAAKVDALV